MPRTRPGWWSLGLIIGLALALVLARLLAAWGQAGGETFFSNPLLAVPMILAGACGVSAFFTGLISIIIRRERAVLVFVTTIIGLFVLAFWLGEIISPH